ncbi:MAG TPA: hypothetical protein VGF88_22690 [Acidobacteriaceae bacterium]|jgi:hypothetical protein
MIADLLSTYYDGITRRDGWQQPLSDAFRFVSPGGRISEGKSAYVDANNGFLRLVTAAHKKEMLIDGDTACVWMSYDLRSPRGTSGALDAVEIWTASGGRLASLTIYFDTAAFQNFMKG